MKFVFASDSFKGSLTCETINAILTETAKSVFPACECVPLLIADGGEGTLEAVITQKQGKIVYTQATDPLGNQISTRYGVFDDCALICMSEISGLPLVPVEKRNARYTTTYGTGELVRHAVQSGYKKIFVTLGGSATNDGGVGALQALGYAFYDKDGKPCKGIGDELWKIAYVDDSNALDFSGIEMTVLCDVSNPLLGEKGATYTYGKQKGATETDLAFLESGMSNFASVLQKKFSNDPNIAGGGAAGGLGAALRTVFHAKMQSGIKTVLDLCDFDNAVKDASLVITGEGRVDFQSANGKVIDGVLSRANGVPVVAIAGSIGDGADALYKKGLTAAFAIVNKPMELVDALNNAETLYRQAAENVFRLFATKI